MGFAQEMRDFVAGFKAGSDMIESRRKSKREDRKLESDEEEREWSRGYRDRSLESADRTRLDAAAQREGYGSHQEKLDAEGKFGGGDGGGTGTFEDADIDAAAKGIRTIESGSAAGNYNAIGQPTKTGDRAYGAYQVMGANVPSWTKKHFGESLSPQEFLKNREAQDAVFKGEFGSYFKKYGPAGAARAWFGGEGNANKKGAYDPVSKRYTGDYGGQFVGLFNRFRGGQQAPQVAKVERGPDLAPPPGEGVIPTPSMAPLSKPKVMPVTAAVVEEEPEVQLASAEEEPVAYDEEGNPIYDETGPVIYAAKGGVLPEPKPTKYAISTGPYPGAGQPPVAAAPAPVAPAPAPAVPAATGASPAWTPRKVGQAPTGGGSSWRTNMGEATPGQIKLRKALEPPKAAAPAPVPEKKAVAGEGKHPWSARYGEAPTVEGMDADYLEKLPDHAFQAVADGRMVFGGGPRTPEGKQALRDYARWRIGDEAWRRGTAAYENLPGIRDAYQYQYDEGGMVKGYADGGLVEQDEWESIPEDPRGATGMHSVVEDDPVDEPEVIAARERLAKRQQEYAKIKKKGPQSGRLTKKDDGVIPDKGAGGAKLHDTIEEANAALPENRVKPAPTAADGVIPVEDVEYPRYGDPGSKISGPVNDPNSLTPGMSVESQLQTPAPAPTVTDPELQPPTGRPVHPADADAGRWDPLTAIRNRTAQRHAEEDTNDPDTLTPAHSPEGPVPDQPDKPSADSNKPAKEVKKDIEKEEREVAAAPSFADPNIPAILRGGMKVVNDEYTKSTSPVPNPEEKREQQRRYVTNADAPSQQEMQEIFQAVDPEGKLDEEQRTMKALQDQYDFFMARRNPVMANRAVANMLLHSKKAAAQFGSLAQVAIEEGRFVEAAQILTRGYAAIPDGKGLKVEPKVHDPKKPPTGDNLIGFNYEIIDRSTGKAVSKGLATKENMMVMASSMADGTGWLKQMFDVTRQTAGGGGGTSSGRPSATTERAERTEAQVGASNELRDALKEHAANPSDDSAARVEAARTNWEGYAGQGDQAARALTRIYKSAGVELPPELVPKPDREPAGDATERERKDVEAIAADTTTRAGAEQDPKKRFAIEQEGATKAYNRRKSRKVAEEDWVDAVPEEGLDEAQQQTYGRVLRNILLKNPDIDAHEASLFINDLRSGHAPKFVNGGWRTPSVNFDIFASGDLFKTIVNPKTGLPRIKAAP